MPTLTPPKTPAPLPIVEVDWIDSHTISGWRSPDEWRECTDTPARCRTAGYLLRDDEQAVVIVQQVNDQGDYGEAMVIPKVCVQGFRHLCDGRSFPSAE